MEVVRFCSFDALRDHADTWDRLAAGVPFRSWCWLSSWWRHYGSAGQLFVLAVLENKRLIGAAPWYRVLTPQHGRTLRFLGDIEACSEYCTILTEPGRERAVAETLAQWLQHAQRQDRWDTIALSAVDPDDSAISSLGRSMANLGCRQHARTGPGCWRVALPASWDDYLARMSKPRRKKLRRMQRQYVDTGQAVWHTAGNRDQLREANRVLIELHQRRRKSLDQPGCFASSRYRAFHEEVLPGLLEQGGLGLHWVELAGRPIAAEYHLLGRDTVYCYQGGLAPESARISPGQIATLLAFRQAIRQRYCAFDFLRGDEPYKKQWQARFQPNLELTIAARHMAAQLRHGIWLTGLDLKQWAKSTMGAMNLH